MVGNNVGAKDSGGTLVKVGLLIGALIIGALLFWQAVVSGGAPDPTLPRTSSPTAALQIATLVFREGLECILVLTAITAGLMGANARLRRPIVFGVAAGAVATLITWFIAVNIIDSLTDSIPALSVQAATGLLAIVVLLVVMNWFFHKIYWTGWISMHNRKKRDLVQEAADPNASKAGLLWGLGLLGFSSFYREGFEVVLFLQSYRLQLGSQVVFYGAVLGLIFSVIVALLNFVGHQRLPYKRMLTITGALLAVVLFVMVGEEVFEMQQAGWIGTTNIPWLEWIPAWAGVWLSIFPNWETVISQIVAIALVVGSYLVSRYRAHLLPMQRGQAPFSRLEAPPQE